MQPIPLGSGGGEIVSSLQVDDDGVEHGGFVVGVDAEGFLILLQRILRPAEIEINGAQISARAHIPGIQCQRLLVPIDRMVILLLVVVKVGNFERRLRVLGILRRLFFQSFDASRNIQRWMARRKLPISCFSARCAWGRAGRRFRGSGTGRTRRHAFRRVPVELRLRDVSDKKAHHEKYDGSDDRFFFQPVSLARETF